MARYFSASDLNSLSYIISSESRINSGRFPEFVAYTNSEGPVIKSDELQKIIYNLPKSSPVSLLKRADLRNSQIENWEFDVEKLQARKARLQKIGWQLRRDSRHGKIYRDMEVIIDSQIWEVEEQITDICREIWNLEQERDYALQLAQDSLSYDNYLSGWYQLYDK